MAKNKGNFIRWLIAGLAIVILFTHPPGTDVLSVYAAPLLIYLALTALSVSFKVAFTHGELSLAHGIGMVAILSMPVEAQKEALWAVGIGAVLGESARLIWQMIGQLGGQALPAITPTALAKAGFGVGRAVIGLFLASLTYQAVGGVLPVSDVDAATILPVMLMALVYVLVKVGLFGLDTRLLDGAPRFTWNSAFELLAALVLPIPFAVLAAGAYSMFSQTAFGILVAALMMVIVFIYGISRSRTRLRRRMEEIESLAALSETLRSNLELKPLLRSVETHVRELMGTDSISLMLAQAHNGGMSLLAHVQRTQKPLLLARRVQAQASALGVEVGAEIVSWVGVPLVGAGKPIGALAASSQNVERHFGQDDLRRLTIIAAGASVALENAQRQEEQTRRVHQLATLNQILALLSGTLSPDAVLDTVITSASALSDATGVTVYLYWDDAKVALALMRSAGFSPDFLNAPPDPLLGGLARAPHISAEAPVIVSDVERDPRTAHLRAVMISQHKHAWIELPLAVGGVAVGVLGLYFDDPYTPSAESVELLRTFANQVAQAITNARLFAVTDEALERRVGQLLALAEVGQELTAIINLQKICEVVLRHALDASQANAGYLFLRGESARGERSDLEAIAHHGYALDVFTDATVVTRPAWQAALQGGSSSTAASPPARLALNAGTRSVLIVPIQRGGATLGALALESGRMNAFSLEDTQFITQLSNQAVIAIDNAHLFQRIAEALDRLQVILDAMDEALILIDAEGFIALANPRVEMLGLTPEEMIGRSIDDLMDEPGFDLPTSLGFGSNAEIRKLVKDLRSGWTERPPLKYALGTDHTERHLLRQIIPIADEGGQAIGALLVFHDESESVRLEQAREEFSRMIIHDLRGPLTAITTSMTVLNNIIPKDAPYREMVDMTTDASRRSIRKLLDRVNALLDIARMESGQMHLDTKPTEIASLIDSVCIELSPLAHELNVKLESKLPDELPAMLIDADKVERLLQNLLDNALKFSPLDGIVMVRAHLPENGFARIEVIDQGPGVPDDYKNRLFERFVQVAGRSGRRRGTGLGLAFCRLVAEAHGGRIWIEDNPTGGSVFAFTLPVVTAVTE